MARPTRPEEEERNNDEYIGIQRPRGSTAVLSILKEANGQMTETSTISTRAGAAVQGDTQKSAGHVIVDTLVAHGIKRAHVVPGESFLDVLDGLHGSGIVDQPCSGANASLGKFPAPAFALLKGLHPLGSRTQGFRGRIMGGWFYCQAIPCVPRSRTLVEHHWQRGRSSRTPKREQPSKTSALDHPSARRWIKAKRAALIRSM